ncbi:MAG: hypothetical protein CSA97_00755 [Bacteroidetes bacterium]|nr:MAG: hypothetical protein CSA97_00755 [Bacteroidota bacterium]
MQAYTQLLSPRALLALLAPIFLLSACKKDKEKEDPFADEDERVRLEAYQETHYKGKATDLGEGAFSVSLKEGDGQAIGAEGWLLFDYVAKDLDGHLLATSLRDTAKQHGMYKPTEPYQPAFRPIKGNLFFSALQGQKVGAEVLLATPSYVEYPKDLWRAPQHRSVLCTLIPRELVADPIAREKKLIEEYIAQHPEQEYQQVGNSYYRWIETEGQGAEVGPEYTSFVFYEGYLLNGFLIDTNSRELAMQHGIPVAAAGAALKLDYLTEKNLIPLFRGIAQGLKIGTVFHVIAPSPLAYGEGGGKAVQPYTPLHYRVSLTNALPPQ